MINPAPDERIIARRPQGPGPVLKGMVLTGAVALFLFAVVAWAILGTVPLRGVLIFLVTFTAINAAAQVLIRRRIDYCLTDRRLLLAPDRAIPLDDIQRFHVGPHSLTVDTPETRHRIVALRSPAWLATRLNRCRAEVSPETGEVAA
jgi:hypothetical protein